MNRIGTLLTSLSQERARAPRRARQVLAGVAGVTAAVLLFGCSSNTGNSPSDGAGGSRTDGTGGKADTAGDTSAGGGGSAGAGGGSACQSTEKPGETVDVPAATFGMGCNASADKQCKDDELPQHMVSLDAFAIDRTEVTQSEYTACVNDGACQAPACAWDCANGDLPAGCVHFDDAKSYCTWANGRLPTEAEWELAARGTDGRVFPWGNDAPDCDHVNFAGCGDVAQKVGSHPSGASPYGALDMAGNVVEMVADWYDAGYYAVSPDKDPTGPATGAHYVGRGGGYKSEAIWQRTSARDTYDSTDASLPLGFRCAH